MAKQASLPHDAWVQSSGLNSRNLTTLVAESPAVTLCDVGPSQTQTWMTPSILTFRAL